MIDHEFTISTYFRIENIVDFQRAAMHEVDLHKGYFGSEHSMGYSYGVVEVEIYVDTSDKYAAITEITHDLTIPLGSYTMP